MNAPRRWIEDPSSQAGAWLREAAALEEAPIEARRRVAKRLRQRPAPVPMMRFALAGVVTAVAIVAVIRVSSRGAEEANDAANVEAPSAWVQLHQVEGEVQFEAGEGGARVAVKPGAMAQIAVGHDGLVATGGTASPDRDPRTGPKTFVEVDEETELSFSQIEGAPVIDLHHGMFSAKALAITGVRAGEWRVRTAASMFAIERHGEDFVVEVQEGSVTIEGPRRAVVSAGERFSALEKTAPPKEEPPRAAQKTEASDEALYQRARDAKVPAEAIALYDRAAALRGPYAEIAAYQAARANMNRASFAEAIARFERFLAAHEKSAYAPEARLDLIECRIRTGDLDRARADLEIFLERHPDSERASELRRLREELAGRAPGEKK